MSTRSFHLSASMSVIIDTFIEVSSMSIKANEMITSRHDPLISPVSDGKKGSNQKTLDQDNLRSDINSLLVANMYSMAWSVTVSQII